MTIETRVGGVLKDVKPKVNVAGVWRDVKQAYVRVSGTWKELLATGWDVPNASYSSLSFSVGAQNTTPVSMFFKPQGDIVYVYDLQTEEIYQYTLSTPWDISTASYDSKSLDFSSSDVSPSAIFIKPDGLKVYLLDYILGTVSEHNLNVAWDISAGTSATDVSISDTPSPFSMTFKPDGTKMYVSSTNPGGIYQYTLSTPWDISTASYDSINYSTDSQDPRAFSVFFKTDGTKMYVLGNSTTNIYQYTLSTPWDISTASYDSTGFDVFPQESDPTSIFFPEDGSQMYVVGSNAKTIYQYDV